MDAVNDLLEKIKEKAPSRCLFSLAIMFEVPEDDTEWALRTETPKMQRRTMDLKLAVRSHKVT